MTLTWRLKHQAFVGLKSRFDLGRAELLQVVGRMAGFAINELGHLPAAGEHFTFGRHRFEVIDRDGLRIDQLLVSPLMPDEPEVG